MHILFLSDNFPPEVNAPASRTYEHCREWVRLGHQVTVITCAPNFPTGRVFDGYRNRLWQREEMDGIHVIRVWSYITANAGFGRRIADYVSYMASSFVAGLFVRRVDIIVGTSPQFFTTCSACMLGVAKGRPWIFELRDLWPESISALGAIRSKRLLDLLEGLELSLYRNAAAIVSVTHAFKRNLVTRGVDPAKIHVVTNGVDTSRFMPIAKDSELLTRYALGDCFVAGYIGTHGMAHGLDTLIDAAILLRDNPRGNKVKLLLLGDGAERQRLTARAASEKLDNILFLESAPKEEVVRYWSILDAAIIHLRNAEIFTTVIPSKLFECMGMAIPVLHGVDGESAEIVVHHRVGLTFEPENASDLADRIYRLREDPFLRSQLSKNAGRAAGHYDRTSLARTMLDILERYRGG